MIIVKIIYDLNNYLLHKKKEIKRQREVFDLVFIFLKQSVAKYYHPLRDVMIIWTKPMH